MSGIAGVLNLDGRPADPEALRAMTDVVAYRGPDGIASRLDGPIGLAHLQHCTTTESLREIQPFASSSERYLITCDGRVDNREELIPDLQARAPVGLDSTDVELILHAFTIWGADCLKHFVGEFAFAIWDRLEQRLFCARDPIGARAFHYSYDGRRFLFGTEIKQLLTQHESSPELNQLMLGLFLSGKPLDGEMTFYQQIRRLRGGHFLTVSAQGLKLDEYWCPDPTDQIRVPDGEYEERLVSVFKKAVASRLRSHRPVGIMLSGGMDSSSICCTAEVLRREEPGRFPELHAFSFAFSEEREPDAPHFILAMQEKYGFPLKWLDAHDFWGLQDIGEQGAWDEPFVIPYEAQWHKALEQIKDQQIGTVLTGLGGDDLLAISPLMHLRDQLRRLKLKAVWGELSARQGLARWRVARRLLPALLPQWARALRPQSKPRMPPWLTNDFCERSGLVEWQRDHAAKSFGYPRSHIQVLKRQFDPRHGVSLLPFEHIGAHHSTEMRHPFWDVRVVDFLIRVPPERKSSRGVRKTILREAMKGIVPDIVLERRVRSDFSPFLDAGLRDKQAEHLQKLLERPMLAELGAVDAEALRVAYHKYREGDNTLRRQLYNALVTESWLRQSSLPSAAASRSGVTAMPR